MTLQEAKSVARHLGLTLRTVRSGDYRVNFRDGNEMTAYYTDSPSTPRLRWPVSERCELDRLAAMNKCLAQSNKSRTAAKATREQDRRAESPYGE